MTRRRSRGLRAPAMAASTSTAASSRYGQTCRTTSCTRGGTIDFSDVEAFLLELASRYEIEEVRYDPRYLQPSMDALAGRLPAAARRPS